MSALDDLTSKLALKQTLSTAMARKWLEKVRELVRLGKSPDQAAIIAAADAFSDFNPTRYNYQGTPIETFLDALENL
jgi:hypothetical protein